MLRSSQARRFGGHEHMGKWLPGRPHSTCSTRSVLSALAVSTVLSVICFSGISCEGKGTRPANFILITMDTTRADHLGCYGCEVASTPHLDRFAATATQFDNAITPMASTLPSHSTMHTGLTPLRHGVRANGTFKAPDNCTTLAEVLRGHRYSTAAFVSAYVLDRKTGLAQGFDHYDDDFELQRRAHDTTARAMAWLDSVGASASGRRAPVFLWVHYFDAHKPLEPIEPFASSTRGTAYDAEISAMDASIGELLAALDRQGLARNAHIVIVADHGESQGDHGYVDHGLLLYENDCHVPFLWRTPGQEWGRRSETLVGTVDIFATALDVLGVGDEEAFQSEGASLASLLRGEVMEDRPGLYMETMLPFFLYEWSPLFAWRTADWKFIESPVPELYNLRDDPLELQNLAESQSGKARNLESKLRDYRERWGTTEVSEQRNLTRFEKQKLESLGYIIASAPNSIRVYSSLANPATHIRYERDLLEALTQTKNRRWRKALSSFQVLVEVLPRSPIVTLGMGHALLGLKRFEEALPWLDRHLERRPDDGSCLALRADALFGLKRYSDAVASYDRVAHEDLGPNQIHRKLQSLLFLRRFTEAYAYVREQYRLALAFDRAEQWELLVEAAQTLEATGMDHPSATEEDFEQQIFALVQLGLLEQAEFLQGKGRERHCAATAAVTRGHLFLGTEQWDKAIRAYEKAASLGKQNLALTLAHSQALRRLGRLEAAESLLQYSIQTLTDEDGSLQHELLCVLTQQKRIWEALALLRVIADRGLLDRDEVAGNSVLRPLRVHKQYRDIMHELESTDSLSSTPPSTSQQ